VHTFGNQDDCAPSVRYIAFFGAEFPALGSGQQLGLAITSLLLGLYTLLTLHELKAHRTHARAVKKSARQDEENPPPAIAPKYTAPSTRVNMDGIRISMPEPALYQDPTLSSSPVYTESRDASQDLFNSALLSSSHPRRPPQPNVLSSHVDPMFLSLALFHIIIFMYFVVNTEILLRRNPAANNSDGQWGFGQVRSLDFPLMYMALLTCTCSQIFAIIVVVPPLLSVIEALQTHGVGTLYHHQNHDTSGHEV
jgi:hypothetical protein